MASDCTVITVNHPNSAASEVVGEAGFVTNPNVGAVRDALRRALGGERPSHNPVEAASTFDWNVITDQTEDFYSEIAMSY
jgi:glycosyltransferase involved in cell wall biosynthesis